MKRKRLRLLVLGLSWLVVGTVVALVVPEVAVAVLGFVVLLLLWLKGAFMRIVQPDSTRGVSRPEHLQQAVRRLLPPGTSVLQAQAEMEQRGFTCTPVAAGR
ncbi:MAG TPA: hypothetical protein VGW38_00845, partial [Chloroflexota bacterium]|nr:hypothetical protein [Chloroflexota bacterium]